MKRRPRKLRNITKPTDGIWHPASRGSERMTGWEKVANPAERAVAVVEKWPGEAQQATPLGSSNSAHSPVTEGLSGPTMRPSRLLPPARC